MVSHEHRVYDVQINCINRNAGCYSQCARFEYQIHYIPTMTSYHIFLSHCTETSNKFTLNNIFHNFSISLVTTLMKFLIKCFIKHSQHTNKRFDKCSNTFASHSIKASNSSCYNTRNKTEYRYAQIRGYIEYNIQLAALR